MNTVDWLDKPYYSLNAYFKHTYGQKIYKIAVDAGLTCPNRDGSLDDRGCIFCSAGGSGDFAVKLTDYDSPYHLQYDRGSVQNRGRVDGETSESVCQARQVISVKRQIERGMARFNKRVGERFVIYFQAYTNTYGDIRYLRDIWTAALESEQVVGISIATRPDCLGFGNESWQEQCQGVLALLTELKNIYEPQGKFIWVELGLQTIHEKTAAYIRRGYPLAVYDEAVKRLSACGIPYITHIILGLPGETREMMLDTVQYVNTGHPFGVKLQLLHVLKGTELAEDYRTGTFHVMDMEEYIALVMESLEYISQEVVIHRVTGDGPKNILLAPEWSGNKRLVLNTLHRRMREEGRKQGDKVSVTSSSPK